MSHFYIRSYRCQKILGSIIVILIIAVGFIINLNYQMMMELKKLALFMLALSQTLVDYEHDQGRKAVVEAFGDAVETTYVESVSEGPDAERAITQMARDHDLIFTTSFGYMNPTIKVAKKFKKVKFEHATGYQRADNVATYAARFYEGRHLIG
ncbi:MAG: hypothetical protein CM15mP111_2970 [Hyphomicrobiales bacterium]|nr:MAG: hypothetical protein CM15mP111_2970 [Hyphomicrobiales bacterium]